MLRQEEVATCAFLEILNRITVLHTLQKTEDCKTFNIFPDSLASDCQ
jgi:hypothetical protein